MLSFSQFLKDVCEIPVGKIAYYERWVTMYLDRLKSSGSNPADSSPAPFLESLGPKVEKWRIAEARRAIQLYRYYKQRTTDEQGPASACKMQNAGEPDRNEKQPLTASDQGILDELQQRDQAASPRLSDGENLPFVGGTVSSLYAG